MPRRLYNDLLRNKLCFLVDLRLKYLLYRLDGTNQWFLKQICFQKFYQNVTTFLQMARCLAGFWMHLWIESTQK